MFLIFMTELKRMFWGICLNRKMAFLKMLEHQLLFQTFSPEAVHKTNRTFRQKKKEAVSQLETVFLCLKFGVFIGI
jgi:hypothetical protein